MPVNSCCMKKYGDLDAVEAHKNSEHYQSIVVKEVLPLSHRAGMIRVKKLL